MDNMSPTVHFDQKVIHLHVQLKGEKQYFTILKWGKMTTYNLLDSQIIFQGLLSPK